MNSGNAYKEDILLCVKYLEGIVCSDVFQLTSLNRNHNGEISEDWIK